MQTAYEARRGQIQTYFDRTAMEAWRRLTSDAPVSKIRATVRAGRDAMRATLLGYLPDDLRGLRLLDAGCGTGALSIEAAGRGASVTAIDLSPSLVRIAAGRAAEAGLGGRIDFKSGDMLDPSLGRFDAVIAMDSLIHYRLPDALQAVQRLAAISGRQVLFTFAPRTPPLALMHALGRLFPRGDRAPAIEPVGERALRRALGAGPALAGWRTGRTHRVASGFYTSQAQELVRR